MTSVPLKVYPHAFSEYLRGRCPRDFFPRSVPASVSMPCHAPPDTNPFFHVVKCSRKTRRKTPALPRILREPCHLPAPRGMASFHLCSGGGLVFQQWPLRLPNISFPSWSHT